MAQAIEKITLNVGRAIPFNKLILSEQNVRRVKAGVSIEDLAEDIARRGLLTSLNVRAEVDGDGKETGFYRIPAGGRRYRALELLVSRKRLAKTHGIPCIVSSGDTLETEDSLAENVQRVELHPLDQYRAFRALREQGVGEEEIAARFFVSAAIVRQRLRLASVSPRLLELYANEEMKLEQIMAFSISNDHVRQEQVWDTVSRQQVREPYYIRRLLTETTIRASDRRTVYVGIDAYVAAGGVVMRDLFEQDNGGWLQDPALLEQLALEKLAADAEAIKAAEGWKWVEAAFDFPYGHTAGLRRFYGHQAEMTDEETARYGTLKAEYDDLDAAYAEAEETCEQTEHRLEELGNELDRINDRPYVFDPQDVARGGVFISLGAGGELKIERGFVRPEDEPQPETVETEAVMSGSDDGYEVSGSSSTGGARLDGRAAAGDEAEEEDGAIRPISDRLLVDLTATRTVALRNALANNPAVAFIAVLHAFVLKSFYHYGSGTCLELTLQSATFGQTEGLSGTVWAREIDQRQEAWGQDLPKLPEDLWDFLIGLDEVSRLALFAHCASLSLIAKQIESISQLKSQLDTLNQQLQQAKQLYGSLNKITNMADVASLLNEPSIRKALPQDFNAIETLFKGTGSGVFGSSASKFLQDNSTYRTDANDFYAQELLCLLQNPCQVLSPHLYGRRHGKCGKIEINNRQRIIAVQACAIIFISYVRQAMGYSVILKFASSCANNGSDVVDNLLSLRLCLYVHPAFVSFFVNFLTTSLKSASSW